MRKILITYLPASLLFTLLAMVLLTCGGGGGDGGGGAPLATLTGLSITGPASVREYGTATYTATASFDDNTTSTVTPTWDVDLATASISSAGELYCQGIENDEMATVTATFISGGVTKTDTMNVTITNLTTIPYTEQMLSGVVLYEEISPEGGGYTSYLFFHNADFTYGGYYYVNDGTNEDYGLLTGTWSIGASDELILSLDSGTTFTVRLISDSPTGMEVLTDDGSGRPWIESLEKTVPVDPAKLPGTYAGSDGYTWVFNANGTGSVTIFGGINFTWSVDSDGVLKMPGSTGYTAVLYARATSQSTATEYTILKTAFPEQNTSTGDFYKYYGGLVLTRQ